MQPVRPGITIDELIEERVTRAVEKALAPYVRRLEPISRSTHDQTSAVEPLAYTVKDAASALGVSRGLLYQLIASGELPAIKLGSRRLIPREAIVALLQRR